MAVYGVDTYGIGVYGKTVASTFVVPRFEAVPLSLGRNFVSWEVPGGSWTKFRLLRNFYGFAEGPNDGVILGEWTPSNLVLRLTDYGQPNATVDPTAFHLPHERFVYYSVMLDTGTDSWVFAGGAIALSIGDYNSSGTLYNLLPQYWREQDAITVTKFVDGLPDPSGRFNAPLQRFLNLVGNELDLIRTEYTSLRWLHDVDRVSGNLLPLLVSDLGGVGLDLGITQNRRLARNLTYLHKVKGTRPGVEGVIFALTGWGASAVIGKNLLLDNMFQTWSGTNTAREEVAGETTGTFTPGYRLSTAATATTRAYSVNDITGGETILKEGLKVTGSTWYAWAMQTYRESGDGVVAMSIRWYDAAGTFIQETAATSTTETTATWMSRGISVSSPATAAYAVLVAAVVAPTTTTAHLLRYALFADDTVQVDYTTNFFATYESAREVILGLDPTRVNLIPNPSFELALDGWQAEGSATLTRSTATAVVNSYSVKVAATGAGDVGVELA